MPYTWDLFFDVKTKEEAIKEFEKMCSRYDSLEQDISGMIDLAQSEGWDIQAEANM